MEHLEQIIKSEYKNMTGIIISKNHSIIYEAYFNDYIPSDTVHIASVTKSIISLLMGIASDKGYLKVTQRVLDFFPTYTIKRGEKTIQDMTIEHLLTMTAPYKFKYEPYTKVFSSNDWTKAALDLLGGKTPVDFKYTTVGIQILTGILAESTGMSVREFAGKYLFTPLGIKTPVSKEILSKEAHFAFLKEKTEGWVVDPMGVNTGGWGLALSTMDLLKIGHLCLNEGRCQDQQIVSKEWLDMSTKVHSHWQDLSYGYLWWLVKDGYAAIGDGGNVIYVNPKKDLVIAITSSFKPRAKDRIEFIEKYVIPLV